MKTTLITLLLTLLVSTGAFAQQAAEKVSVDGPWVRLNAPGTQVTGAFMVIKNAADKEIKVVKAESPAAKVTELHDHINDGGVMKMRQIPSVAIKAKGEATLKPGSLHVMLIDLKAPLKEGDMVPITLGFDDGSSKKIEAKVINPMAEGHGKH